MDINRVELKGRIGGDITYRKSKNGNDWASFVVVTNEYNPRAKIEKEKSMPTWSNIAVFNDTLVSKLKHNKARQGDRIWIVGKLFTSQKEKLGHKVLYTSIVASELETYKGKDDDETHDIPKPPTNDEIETDF